MQGRLIAARCVVWRCISRLASVCVRCCVIMFVFVFHGCRYVCIYYKFGLLRCYCSRLAMYMCACLCSYARKHMRMRDTSLCEVNTHLDGAGVFNVPTPLPLFQSWRKDAQQQLTQMNVYFTDTGMYLHVLSACNMRRPLRAYSAEDH